MAAVTEPTTETQPIGVTQPAAGAEPAAAIGPAGATEPAAVTEPAAATDEAPAALVGESNPARYPIRASFLRPARDGAILACLALAAAHFLGAVQVGVDAHAYWASNPLAPYGATRPAQFDAYFYSPAFTQALGPLHGLPWPWFAGIWTLLLASALVWQAGLWTAVALLLIPVFADLTLGNIHLLLAAAILVGFRYPAAWAFVLLTKITPGVGLVWFAARREWRNLAIALGGTAAIAAVSFVIAPIAWFDWVGVLRATAAYPWPVFTINLGPLPLRLMAAALLVFWGARTDRRWTVALGATLALPILYVNGLATLVALVPLLRALGPTPASQFLDRARAMPRGAQA
jgi:hypothetical protein